MTENEKKLEQEKIDEAESHFEAENLNKYDELELKEKNLKIKFRQSGIRVVYFLERKEEMMNVIIISIRDDDYVYKQADKRFSPISSSMHVVQMVIIR